jgi:hypothetical protein
MALKLDLFVHGVPKGQKIWGPQEEDRIFIESFYSQRSNIDVQLKIDVMKIGVDTYCYYTYIRGSNMLDTDNRQGSYFALTIRVNAFYNDLFKMYSILDSSYQTFILEKILATNESSTKYLIDDFQQCEDSLKELEKQIINYLSTFSNSSNFINLDKFATNSKLASLNLNLLECNNKNALTYIKEKGSVSVSPFHPSKQFSEYIRKQEEEIEKLKLEAQKQIGEEKRKSEQQIQNIKAEYSTVDKKISELNRQIEQEKSNVASFRQKFESKEQECIRIQNSVNAAKLNEADNKLNDGNNKQLDSKKTNVVNNYFLLTTVLVTLLTLLVLVFFSVKHFSDDKKLNTEINSKVDVINNKIDVITNLLNSEKKSENNTTVKQTIQPTEPVNGAAGSAGTKRNPAKPSVPKKTIQSPGKNTTNQNN